MAQFSARARRLGSLACSSSTTRSARPRGECPRCWSRSSGAAWRRLLRTAGRHANAVVVLTERDEAAVEAEIPSARVVRIALGYELPEFRSIRRARARTRIVCVGSFVHPPNVEGASWLAQEVFPSVRRRVPGRRSTSSARQPSGRGARAPGRWRCRSGDVREIWPYLNAAAVVAARFTRAAG